MGWETVEALPGSSSGSAFRDGAEPVEAQRIGLTLGEKVRLFWHSTPELPTGRAAEGIAVTPHHLYVQRVDGSRARVRLAEIRGERLERGLLVYGVIDDSDLLLTYRSRCAVQDRLAAIVRGSSASVEPWRETRGVIAAVVFTLALIATGVGLLISYPLEGTLEHMDRGFYTSEQVLGTYGGFASLFASLVAFFWAPSRWRVDAVGLTRTRGVLGWMPFTVPPERFRRAVMRPTYFKPKNQRRYHAGWGVDLELKEPTRVGTIFRTSRVPLAWFSFGQRGPSGKRTAAEAGARALAERLRQLLSLQSTDVLPVRP